MYLVLRSAAGSVALTDDIVLTQADGLYGVSHAIQTVDYANADGEAITGIKQQSRSVKLQVKIMRNVVRLRRKIVAICARQDVTLELHRGSETYLLDCTAKNVSSAATNGAILTVGLFAPQPYWRANTEKIVWVAGWENLFSWPCEITEEGIEFGRRTETSVVKVINNGAIETGMLITFYARSDVINPALYDASDSDRYIRFTVTLGTADRLEVNTTRGRNMARMTVVRANGEEENAFPMLDPRSVFLQLAPGENQLRYDADDGNEVLDVSIALREQFLEV